ncbi:MAG: hypothetical protein AVDCRST_MAG32-563, partial [uncultured Nocardioides sp.]
ARMLRVDQPVRLHLPPRPHRHHRRGTATAAGPTTAPTM